MSQIENKYTKSEKGKQVFVNFVMPMIILAIRVEMDILFKMNYRTFLGNKGAITTSDQAPNEFGPEIIAN